MIFFVVTAVFFRAGSLQAVASIYEGLAILPTVRPDGRNTMIAAALCRAAAVEPEDLRAADPLRPNMFVPALLGLAMVLVLIRLGERQSYQFIYFQF